MDHETPDGTARRTFLQQAGSLAAAAAAARAQPRVRTRHLAIRPPLSRRACPGGRWARPASRSRCSTRGPAGARRRPASSGSPSPSGVRVFDTAKRYRSEPDFKKWFEQAPEVRKQIFLVTKDMPRDARRR